MLRAYALIERCRTVAWPLWTGVLAGLVALGLSPVAYLLAGSALMAGRILGAADPVSAERCRRVVAVVGLLVTPALALVWAIAPGLTAIPGALALAGWVCLSLGEKDERRAARSGALAGELVAVLALLAAAWLLPVPRVASAVFLGALFALAVLTRARAGRSLSEPELFAALAPAALLSCSMAAGESGLVVLATASLVALSACGVPLLASLASGGDEGDYAATMRRALDDLAERELSDREREVLVRTLCGEPRRVIAQALDVSESTVGTNRTRGYEKLGVSSKVELVSRVSSWTSDAGSLRPDGSGRRRVPSWARALLGAALLALLLAPWAGPVRPVVACLAGDVLSCVALVAFLVLAPDTGGRRALRERTGVRPSWERGVVCLLCSVAVPLVFVSSWPLVPGRRSLAALVLALGVLYLGARPVSADPGIDVRTWLRRSTVSGLRELACRGREVTALAGLSLLLGSCLTVPLEVFPGVVEGLWCLVAALGALVFGVAFRPAARDDREEQVAILRRAGLSELQANVALLLSLGEGERAICERLHVAPGTVKSARTRCYRALGIHNAVELREYLEGRAGLTG